ncbi:Zinc knuckle [Carpediemonas membranifera]|uniref:RNA-directed DNA polymerase n=1 Tax=Carpediemonas membranifera TaxID=201153 RepID=A0A8J6E419_9EUKA|nr:Zinc knuckle [Carpediemonas membranifera]|eukprot:KAG9393907.1 Zinc knuckle [Carpediemonas membranifera]
MKTARDVVESAEYLAPFAEAIHPDQPRRPAAPVPGAQPQRADSRDRRDRPYDRRDRPYDRHRQDRPDKRSRDRARPTSTMPTCYNCGGKGHFSPECRKPKVKCEKCGREGHKREFCDRIKVQNYSYLSCFAASSKRRAQALPIVSGSIYRTSTESMLFDCGASATFISPQVAEKSGEKILHCDPVEVTTPAGVITVDQTVPIEVTFAKSALVPRGCTFTTRAYLLPSEYDLIIGYPDMVTLGILPQIDDCEGSDTQDAEQAEDVSTVITPQKLSLFTLSDKSSSLQDRLLARFDGLFEDRVGRPSKLIPYDLVLSDDEPVFSREFFMPPEKKTLLQEHLDDLSRHGFIQPSASAYSSPAFLVPKGKDRTRFVIDFRLVNAKTPPFNYPIPIIEDCLARLRGNTIFATLDCKAGYHQVALTDRSRPLTAFGTPLGRFEYTTMPFGLRNAGSHFQWAMEQAFSDLISAGKCLIYIDDIIVMGRDEPSYIRNLWDVLKRCQEYDLHLGRDKCVFAAAEVEFLGRLVSGDTVRIAEDRIDDIKKLKLPTSKRSAQALVGFLNYFRDFVPNFASRAHPLLQVSAGKAEPGGPGQQAALGDVIAELLKRVSLVHFKTDATHVLMTDASDVGCGAVLLQDGQPIAFMSHAFSAVQTRWSTTEQEAYAIILAVQRWRKFLSWTHFTIRTDHRNLLFMAKSINPKVRRWYDQLADLDFTIRHVPGVDNGAADGLSRVFANTLDTQVADKLQKAHHFAGAHLSAWATKNLLRDWGVRVRQKDVDDYIANGHGHYVRHPVHGRRYDL